MKDSLKSTLTKILESLVDYVDVTINNVTIGSNGYTSITAYKPTHTGTLLCCVPYDYGSVSSKNAWGVNGNGNYLYGTGGATINYVVLRYIYLGGGYCVTQLLQYFQPFPRLGVA